MKEKNPLWRQPTPKMQMTAILMAVEGELYNVQEGVTPSSKIEERVMPFIEQVRQLGQWLETEWSINSQENQ